MAKQALDYGISLIEPGASMREVLDKVEDFIREKGCEPAFPAQSCVNEVAAHYCPTERDDIIYEKGQLVKLDVGVHSEGCVGDNATTIVVGGGNHVLISAVKGALDAAQAILKPGVQVTQIGSAIHKAIASHGVQPVRNLSGHGLDEYVVHAPPSIPNYADGSTHELEAGMVIAIEPFATDGKAGMIFNSTDPTIYSESGKGPVRTPYGRKVLAFIKRYKGLPFTTRWLTKEMGGAALLGLNELRRVGIITSYPPLPEQSGGLVAQHENTYLITEDGYEKLTRLS